MPKPIETYIIKIEFKSCGLSKADLKMMIHDILLQSGILTNYAKFRILNGG